MLKRAVVLSLLGFLSLSAGTSVRASHPFAGSGQLNVNYLYNDLEAGGDVVLHGREEWRR